MEDQQSPDDIDLTGDVMDNEPAIPTGRKGKAVMRAEVEAKMAAVEEGEVVVGSKRKAAISSAWELDS